MAYGILIPTFNGLVNATQARTLKQSDTIFVPPGLNGGVPIPDGLNRLNCTMTIEPQTIGIIIGWLDDTTLYVWTASGSYPSTPIHFMRF